MAQASTSSAPVNLPEESTLDESIFKTIWRDLVTILRNLRSVLIPINWNFNNRDAALRNWDLWGPLVGRVPGLNSASGRGLAAVPWCACFIVSALL